MFNNVFDLTLSTALSITPAGVVHYGGGISMLTTVDGRAQLEVEIATSLRAVVFLSGFRYGFTTLAFRF